MEYKYRSPVFEVRRADSRRRILWRAHDHDSKPQAGMNMMAVAFAQSCHSLTMISRAKATSLSVIAADQGSADENDGSPNPPALLYQFRQVFP